MADGNDFGGDTFGGGGDFGGGQFGGAGGGNSIEGIGGAGDGSGGGFGGGGLGASGAFSGGALDLSAAAGPNPGSPTIGMVLDVLKNTATIASAITGQPYSAVVAGLGLAATAMQYGPAALDYLASGDPAVQATQQTMLGGAAN